MPSTPEPPSQLPSKINNRYVIAIGIASMMITISSTLVLLRFLSRYITKSIKWDDWCCLMSLIFAYGNLITTVLSATIGRSGYHIALYSADRLRKIYQITLANRIIYLSSITLSKLSILLFFLRIFSIKSSFGVGVWIIFGLVCAYWLAAEVCLIFGKDFNPVQPGAGWTSDNVLLPKIEDRNGVFWLTMGILNILLDFVILCLPQPLVWRLHMSTKRKVQISVLLCMGFFVCIASIVRLTALVSVDTTDLTKSLALPVIWSTFEIHVSIICACLPLIPGLLRHYRGNSGIDATSNRLRNGDRWQGGSGNLPLRENDRLDGELGHDPGQMEETTG